MKLMSIIFLTISIVAIASLSTVAGYYQPSWSFCWSKIRPEVKEKVHELRRYRMLISHQSSTRNHRLQQQWRKQQWLAKNATWEELKELLEYPNGTIRTLVYQALIDRHDGSDFHIIDQVFSDTLYYTRVGDGHGGNTGFIGTYLIETAYHLDKNVPGPPPQFVKDINLSKQELEIILQKYRDLKEIENTRRYRHREEK